MLDKRERAERLQLMLAQIAPGENIESVARPPSAGLESAFDSTPPPHETGLQKLAESRLDELTEDEMDGLEAIVMPQNRPVVFVLGEGAETYENVDHPWEELNQPEVKTRISKLLPSVGRIELRNGSPIPFAGTGFVVGKGLLMTNRHVARLFSTGVGMRVAYHAGDAGIDFKKQKDTKPSDTAAFDIRGVVLVHPYWDMAILTVDGLPEEKILNLCVTPPEELVGRNVAVVGYPARDPRSPGDLQDRIFSSQYDVKRLQPGILRPRTSIKSFENTVNAITHDASTLGGNSGSAVLDVNKPCVLALHFAGEYLKANYAVPMYEVARDARVTSACKLNFEGAVTPTRDWEPAWLRWEGNGAVAQPNTDHPAAPAAPLQSPAPSPSAPRPTAPKSMISAPTTHMSSSSLAPSSPGPAAAAPYTTTWTVPIQISISLGAPVEAGQPGVRAAALQISAAEGVEEAVVVDQDYSTRPGYDPSFLDGLVVPLPELAEAMKKDTAQVRADAQVHGDLFELAYYHYSVYMNKKRRTAWFSAANVDGDNRPDIGARSGDRWYRDPRISNAEQLTQVAFEHGIDRGHLTRRQDTAWGEDVDTATAANNDTFHFTNCSLQASLFNQGKDRWQGLEQFLLEQHAKKDKRRMIVITGPLFASNDPVYKNEKMDYSVRCPLQFWKVCVLIREADGQPSATGFILGQEDIANLPGFEESFDVAATQVKISDLEKRTGLDFGDLKNHDHFAQHGAPGTLEAPSGEDGVTQTLKAIRTANDIVV